MSTGRSAFMTSTTRKQRALFQAPAPTNIRKSSQREVFISRRATGTSQARTSMRRQCLDLGTTIPALTTLRRKLALSLCTVTRGVLSQSRKRIRDLANTRVLSSRQKVGYSSRLVNATSQAKIEALETCRAQPATWLRIAKIPGRVSLTQFPSSEVAKHFTLN